MVDFKFSGYKEFYNLLGKYQFQQSGRKADPGRQQEAKGKIWSVASTGKYSQQVYRQRGIKSDRIWEYDFAFEGKKVLIGKK